MLDLIMQTPPSATDLSFDVRYLLGFGAGCSAAAGVLWAFIVTPLKAERDKWEAKAASLSTELNDKYKDDIMHLRAVLAAKNGGGNA